MAWHLKDKELEQKLIGIDTDFSERLNQLCEKWDSNKDGDLYEYMQFSVPFYYGHKLHGEVIFSGNEVEKINEYNPKAWNEYPKEKPESYTKDYLVTIVKHYGKHQVKKVAIDTWTDSKEGGEWEMFDNSPDTEVIAWAEKPEPYQSKNEGAKN